MERTSGGDQIHTSSRRLPLKKRRLVTLERSADCVFSPRTRAYTCVCIVVDYPLYSCKNSSAAGLLRLLKCWLSTRESPSFTGTI